MPVSVFWAAELSFNFFFYYNNQIWLSKWLPLGKEKMCLKSALFCQILRLDFKEISSLVHFQTMKYEYEIESRST